jgi:hypothetical protein
MTAELAATERTDWGQPRSKTVTWHDPAPSTARGLTMAGVDYLRAIADGTLPRHRSAYCCSSPSPKSATDASYSSVAQMNPPTIRSARSTAAWCAPCSTR